MLNWGIIHMYNIKFITLIILKCVLVLLSSFTVDAPSATIHLKNIFHLSKLKLFIRQQTHHFSLHQVPGKCLSTFASMNLMTLITSCKWNHTVFVSFWLTFFTLHNVLKVHLCCNVWEFWHLFIDILLQLTLFPSSLSLLLTTIGYKSHFATELLK